MDEGLVKIRHARSKKDFPFLKLENDEYVEFAFKRSKVWLFMVYLGLSVCLMLMLFSFLFVLMTPSVFSEIMKQLFSILFMIILIMALFAGYFIGAIYRGNRLFITNKHAIQTVMLSPASKSMNIIDLPSIEDASYSQNGLAQSLLHYGTLRLSTIGDETTYTFKYSDISTEELKAVSKLITTAKKQNKNSAEE